MQQQKQQDVSLATAIGGERMSDSATRSKMATIDECFCTVISVTTAVTIGGGVASDTYLLGITVVAALTGTCVITGFLDSAGNAQSVTLPATTVAGFKDFKGAVNAAGALTVTCSNASDDNLVLVHWAHAVAA